MKKSNKISNIAFALGLGLLSFIFLVVLLTSIAFLLHGAVSVIWLILSLIGSMEITYWRLAKDKVGRPLLWVGILLITLIGSTLLVSQTYDSTWDGNDYHKTAIGEMKDGWNPVWEKMMDFHNSTRNPLYTPGAQGQFNTYLTNWTDHYPKATWIFAANIYKATGSIESGKVITLLSVFMLFCFALSFFYKLFGLNKSLIIASLLALNPVIVPQLFDFYNDGVQGNFLIVLILLLTMLMSKKSEYVKQRFILLTTIVATITLTANFKFSGLAYAAIIAACYYVYLLFRRDWKLVKHLTLAGIVSIILGVLVVGASSYVVNTYYNHNPVFPLEGQGKIDIMVAQQPASYGVQSGIHKFVENNLYATSNLSRDATEEPQLKIPFAIGMSELKELHGTSDARQGGYGVWFGGILIVSSIIGLYLLIRYGRKHKKYLSIILLPLVTIGVTVLIFDNTWWARYLPQLILFPIIVVIILFALRAKVLPYLIVFALFFNVILTGALSFSAEVKFTQYSRASIANLKCDPNKPTTIGYGRFYGAVYDIRDACSNIIVSNKPYSEIPQDKITQLYFNVYEVSN